MAERYEIKGRLGRGGIGAVYLAFDNHLGRDVAIKRLLPIEDTRLNRSQEGSLASEAKALASLSHPNIVTIFEFGEDESGPFVVFELIEGDTLKDLIAGGALSEKDFYEVADQILDALVAAQHMNLMHRDLKPANIMLSWLPSGKFRIKVLDFGLSKFAQSPSTQTLDQKGSFLGSIDYIAPEQIELLPLDQRTDLYSLGCVFYFALTQRAPFTGDSLAATMNNHLKGKAIPLEDLRPDLPIAVCRWVMSLMALHPGDRPNNALAAMEGLEAAKKVSNKTITDSISVAKLVVPVVATAQPTMQPRILEHTQQIVRTPVPKARVVPPHPQAGDSRLITSRYQPKPTKTVNQKLLYGVIGSVAVLFVVMGVLISQDQKQRQRAEEIKTKNRPSPIPPPKPAVASVTPPPSANPVANSKAPQTNPAPQTAVPLPPQNQNLMNTSLPANLPPLPAAASLVAYISVGGKILNQNASPFQINSNTELLGAIENIAPGANKFHLLRRPEDARLIPKIQKNGSGHLSVFCLPGFKLGTPLKGFEQQPVESSTYTFSLLFRVIPDNYGGLFRVAAKDAKGTVINNMVKATFSKNLTSCTIGERTEQVKSEYPAEKYRVAFLELDTKKNTLMIWQRGPETNGSLMGGQSMPANLEGPLRIINYEYGYLWAPKEGVVQKPIEIPAMAIHTSILSLAEKEEVAAKLFQGFQRK
jgi:serine/threonine protein kinase